MDNYYTWYVHGETSNNPARNFEGESSNMKFVRSEANAMYCEMVVNTMGPQHEYNKGPTAKEPNNKAKEFYDLLHAVEVHIGAKGQNVTVVRHGNTLMKHFNETCPKFVEKPRNVRLGLCTNGFNPFGCFATPYSCWPIFLNVHNLPLELCMKSKHIFLALVILRPKSPRKNIDVMLRPPIDELKELWTNSIETYDSFRQ
ncbi:hypothetical protein SLA2020_025570 [Shorea laevis]